MSPRTGRPTNDPKRKAMPIRLGESDLEMLEYCQEQTGMSKAEIIREGIKMVYESLKENQK